MRSLLLSSLLLGCAAELAPPPLSLEESCAEGQTAVEGAWGLTENLSAWWEQLDGRFVPVLAQRRAEPTLSPVQLNPVPPDDADTKLFVDCMIEAEHEVVDGLGWVEEGPILVRGRTAQGHWVSSDGVPVGRQDGRVVSEHFFDSNYETMAPDEEVHVLFLLPRPDGSYLLRRRAELMGDMVSGEHTTGGEDAPLDLFRR